MGGTQSAICGRRLRVVSGPQWLLKVIVYGNVVRSCSGTRSMYSGKQDADNRGGI